MYNCIIHLIVSTKPPMYSYSLSDIPPSQSHYRETIPYPPSFCPYDLPNIDNPTQQAHRPAKVSSSSTFPSPRLGDKAYQYQPAHVLPQVLTSAVRTWGWAWEAERKAEQRKLEGEERRKMILDAATSGQWRVDANGKRLIGGLAEGGRDRAPGEVWKDERKLISGPTEGQDKDSSNAASSSALVQHSSTSTSGALVLASDKRPADSVVEQALPDEHPLNKALVAAGLPGTALVSVEDGQIVPHREVVSGEGEGRGRGQVERAKRDEIEKAILGNEREEYLPLSGSGGDQWGFKVTIHLPIFRIRSKLIIK